MTTEFIDNHHSLFPAVKRLGKKCAPTLGFMPDGGFDDYARNKGIIISSVGDELLGYLMFRFSSRYNRIVIVHLAVEDKYRGKGVSTKLLDTLRDGYKDSGANGIVLNCRRDYIKPSEVWERYGFIAKGNKRSRSYEVNYLTTWWYDFSQRNLFSETYEESDKVRALMDSNIIMKLRDADMGVAFDNAKEDPSCLLADWLIDETELCFAPEVYNEINRDDDLVRSQRTKGFLSNFIQAQFDVEEQKHISKDLKEILKGNTVNDESDRRQVASCIAAGIPYFITFDERVIKRKNEIAEHYDVQVLTPQEFLISIDQLLHSEKYAPVLLKGVALHTISKLNAANVQKCVTQFTQIGRQERSVDFENAVTECVNCNGELYTVCFQGQEVAFYGFTEEFETAVIPFIRFTESPLRTSLFCQIISDLLRKCVSDDKKQILIEEKYLSEDQKSFLLNFGFQKSDVDTFLKEIKNQIVIKDELQWKDLSTEKLIRIEKVFFPLKIRDLEIPCYIVPIKAYWAGQLFDSSISGETLYGADPSRLWSFENVYYRHTRPITEKAPGRILWYVSDNKGAYIHSKMIVACSYLTEVHTGKPKDLFRLFKHYGIYEWRDIYELCKGQIDVNIRALRFSHTEEFVYPVSFDTVQQVLRKHTGKRNTFASPVYVPSEVFIEIYSLGFGYSN